MGGSAQYRLAKKISEAEQRGVPQSEIDELKRQRDAVKREEQFRRQEKKIISRIDELEKQLQEKLQEGLNARKENGEWTGSNVVKSDGTVEISRNIYITVTDDEPMKPTEWRVNNQGLVTSVEKKTINYKDLHKYAPTQQMTEAQKPRISNSEILQAVKDVQNMLSKPRDVRNNTYKYERKLRALTDLVMRYKGRNSDTGDQFMDYFALDHHYGQKSFINAYQRELRKIENVLGVKLITDETFKGWS